jgi:hypothetical protein
MTHGANRPTPSQGMQVHGAEGDHLGQIDSIEGEFILVNPGLMKRAFPVPKSLVKTIRQDIVVLGATGDEARNTDWTSAEASATMTVSGEPAEHRPDDLNQVSTTASPGKNAVVDVDTDRYDHRTDMDTNRRPEETR